MDPRKKRISVDPEKLKKGQLLLVKVPPFYDKEYAYEISGAGGKIVRANLHHSPTVKKQWTYDDIELLFGNGMMRFADSAEAQVKESSPEDAASENR